MGLPSLLPQLILLGWVAGYGGTGVPRSTRPSIIQHDTQHTQRLIAHVFAITKNTNPRVGHHQKCESLRNVIDGFS